MLEVKAYIAKHAVVVVPFASSGRCGHKDEVSARPMRCGQGSSATDVLLTLVIDVVVAVEARGTHTRHCGRYPHRNPWWP